LKIEWPVCRKLEVGSILSFNLPDVVIQRAGTTSVAERT
jgi:hypothetical protein